jgi:cyclic pyranopterin phosphate synthase
MSNDFSHLDEQGHARMVDVGAKAPQRREAVAEGWLHCRVETLRALRDQALPKGDVLAVARIAGIQAAKRTQELIPLCHQIPLESVKVDFETGTDRIRIETRVRTTAKTGVEMEALTAVSIAALTLFDMMKAVDKSMHIEGVRVVSKIKE